MIELVTLGMGDEPELPPRSQILWFDLELVPEFYPSWKGRLIINWPPPDRSWWRRAHRNEEMSVLAIRDDSALDAAMPTWNEISLTWQELTLIPSKWQEAMTQWRGVYYIFNTTDGKGYVGSASGEDNLLGRWRNYTATGHGGNRLLRGRDPNTFLFSVLQIVPHDMDSTIVVRLESSWKKRLHTRHPFGLNDN